MDNAPGTPSVRSIYERRFGGDAAFRRGMWRVLCRSFFQRYIPASASVLEIGAGYCEFINAIRCREKTAVDINPDVARCADSGVRVILSSATDLSEIPSGSIDVAFTSNFLEHLTRPEILRVISEARRVLAPDGAFIILQPNIRFCGRDYWMFFDHITPLDDRSISEALETHGFRVTQCIPRFLPYTTKSRLPKSLLLLKIYLRLPILWRIFGAQSLIIATPEDSRSMEHE